MVLRICFLLIVLGIFGPLTTNAIAEQIIVHNDCLTGDDQFVIFTLLNIDYKVNEQVKKDIDKTVRLQRTRRELWKINCSTKTSTCEAVIVKMDSIERKQKLDVLDVILPLPGTIRIAARTGNVVTLVWDPFIKLTVNLSSGRVVYRESDPDGEGNGTAYCQ
jgi:hypothetical protein